MNGFVRNLRSRALLIMLGTTGIIWGIASINWSIGTFYSPNDASKVASVSFGACSLILPNYVHASNEDNFQMPNSQAQSCPPTLLHSLFIKARLQCAAQKSLVRVPGVGLSTAERILRAMDSSSWEDLRLKARLNIEQLKALKDRFVFDGALIACSS